MELQVGLFINEKRKKKDAADGFNHLPPPLIIAHLEFVSMTGRF